MVEGEDWGYHDGAPDSKFRKFNFSDEVEEQVRELFQKKYQILNEQQNWALPPVPQLFSEPDWRPDRFEERAKRDKESTR